MDTTSLRVRAGAHAYEVRIARGAASHLDEIFDAAGLPRRRFVVSAAPIWRPHGRTILRGLTTEEPILVPDGERFKTLQTAGRIYDALIRAEADRGSAIVAVGGGVIGDLAGFVAATFLRGIALAHVPTTLLAQVDSSIGGKVGVNHVMGKNLIGAFHPPVAVACDPSLLVTLPRRELRAGLYEVVKYGAIADAKLFETLERSLAAIFAREPSALLPIIAASCRIKASIVEADEHERNIRRVLNFGHTVAHALESMTKYRRFRHGEAVAYGMLAAAELAVARGAMEPASRDRLHTLIIQMGPLPPVADLPVPDALEAARRDKKVTDGRLKFVISPAIGSAAVVDDVTEEELIAAMLSIGMRETAAAII